MTIRKHLECKAVIWKKSYFTVYKSRRVLFSLFVNISLTTPRINFRISECHHRFSIDLIIIFSAKNGKLFLDHTDPLTNRTLISVICSLNNP